MVTLMQACLHVTGWANEATCADVRCSNVSNRLNWQINEAEERRKNEQQKTADMGLISSGV